MEALNTLLPVLLYVAGIVLLIVLTIVGIKIIGILDKVDKLVDNVEDKVNSFNSSIVVLSKAANGIASISDTIVGSITSAVSKIFRKKFSEEEDYYE